MRNESELRLSKVPFFAGDLVLLAAAYFLSRQAPGAWQMTLLAACVAGGSLLSIIPFILEYRLTARLAESNALATVSGLLENLEHLAEQISGATGRWQNVQESADKTGVAARSIADRMEAELRSFTEFMQKANDSEKANLRLEVEKLHRMEGEWLQVSVRMLDHVFALHQGAMRSGQPNLIAQLTHFQNACLDAVRRVGLTPFLPSPSEPFDSRRHQLVEGQELPAAGATVGATIATGYTYQGRLLRPALVRLSENGQASVAVAEDGAPEEIKDAPSPS